MTLNPKYNDSQRAGLLLAAMLDRASNAPLDEANIAYESARLDKFPVVVVVHLAPGVSVEEYNAAKRKHAEVRVIKGHELMARYFNHEIDSLKWEAVFTPSSECADALAKRFAETENSNVISFPKSQK